RAASARASCRCRRWRSPRPTLSGLPPRAGPAACARDRRLASSKDDLLLFGGGPLGHPRQVRVVIVLVEQREIGAAQRAVGRRLPAELGAERPPPGERRIGDGCNVAHLHRALLAGGLAARRLDVAQRRNAALGDAGEARLSARDGGLQGKLRREPLLDAVV